MSRALAAVFCAALLALPPAVGAQQFIGDLRAVVLAPPPMRGLRAPAGPGGAPSRGGAVRTLLVLVSSRRNRITDTEDWFRNSGLSLPEYELPSPAIQRPGNLPPGVPRRYRGIPLLKAIRQPGMTLLVYGKDPTEARYLVAVDFERGTFRYGYDFTNYLYPTGSRAGPQGIVWAVERDGTLYVSHSHFTYARESRGMNAYLTAIRAGTDRVLWRSAPLVANAATFEVVGDVVISGYGFTAEPDFLYVTNRWTGEVAQRVPLKTAPEYILRKEERLFVRGYNTDYIFGMLTIR